MNIYGKLQKCRVELQQNPTIKKSGENKFAKFKYYELADILPSINKLFLDNGLSSNFSILGQVAKLEIIDAETTEAQVIEFTTNIAEASLKGCTPIQELGAIHTYLKRYLYMNALEIVESDLLDASVGTDKIQQEPKPNNIEIIKQINSYDDIPTLREWGMQQKQRTETWFINAMKKRISELENA